MAQLKFRVQADFEELQRLRSEIAKLKQDIKGTDAIQNPTAFNALNAKLQQTSKELSNVTGRIAQAFAAVESDFKQKIFAASQNVNNFTEKIIAQKSVVKDVAADVRRLGEAYHDAAKVSPMSAGSKLAEWRAAKNALEEEKAALFGLTQEQANARLSVKRLRDEYALLREDGGGTAQTMDMLSEKMKQIGTMVIGGLGLKELGSKIISVRADFESMETSLRVLLGGSQERLNNIMGQIKEYALASPLNTKDMVGAVQMMTSFGIEAEKSIDYLKAIGDISMGDTGKFNGLALAFSQMSSAGKLMGQDLMQMVNAGFNPLEEISRKTGKSIGELKNEMSKGAISSKMVQDAFISAASAGGKFYGMSQEGAKTLNGQISMLQESFDNMFNEIGGKGEGVVMSAVQMATKLVENYEQVGRIIAGLVVTYGTYKVAVGIATIAENGHTLAMTIARAQILITQKAQALLNATMLANPYVLAAVALGTLVGAIIATSDGLTEAEAAQNALNESMKNAKEVMEKYRAETERAIATANDDTLSTSERRKAMNLLISRYPSIIKKYIDEEGHLKNIIALKRESAQLDAEKEAKIHTNKATSYRQDIGTLKNIGTKHMNGSEITDAEKKVEDKAISAYAKAHGRPEWSVRAFVPFKDIYEFYEQSAKKEEYAASRVKVGTGKSNFQDVVGKMSNEQLKSVITTLQKAKATGRKVALEYKELKGLTLEQKDIDELLTYANGIDSARSKKKVTAETKQTLQEQRKNLQSRLDSLTEAEAAGKKGAELKRKIAALQKREDAYNVSNSTDKKKAADDKKALNEAKKLQEKQTQANKEYNDAKIALEDSLEQSYVDSLVNGSEKTIKAMELAHKKELREFEKQKQDYINKKKEKNGGKNVSLDDNEAKKFDYIKSNILTKQENEKKDFYASQIQSMYDYLKQYGTIQEQAYAIAKEYDDKITKEKDENRKKILQKEKESALAKTNSNSLAMNIDWGATFGGIGKVLRDIAKETLKEVEQYMRSAEFKSLSPSDKKAYTDLRDKLRSEGVGETTSPFNFSQWGDIEKQTRAYQESVRHLKEKTEAHAKAVEDLKVAEKELSLATDETTKSIAQSKVDKAQVEVRKTASEMNDAIADKDDKKANLTDSTSKAVQGLDNFSSALQTMSNGTLKGFADGLANLIKSIGGKGGAGGVIGAIGGKAGGLIGAILQIIDALGDDPGGFIKGILDRVAKIVNTIIAELPKLIIDIIKGILNIVGGIVGGIGKLGISVFGNGNEKSMENEIAKLTKANEHLAQSIDDLSKNIGKKDNTNEQSVDAYKKALKEEQDWEKNQRDAINKRASEWSNKGSGFLGLAGKSSFNADASDSNWHVWGDFNKILEKIGSKARVYNATDVWKLSPEEMKELRAQAMDAWREFFDSNKGLKSPEDLVNQYIERAGKQDELSSTLNEKLTGYSWDGFMDSYKSALKNLESTTKDFADNINDLISNALIESFTNEKLKPKIDELYKYIAKAAENGLDDGEIAYIRKANEDIANQGIEQRKIWEQAGLIKKKGDEEQNATANGVSSITFEQANNIVALTTAGNISRDQLKELVNVKLSTIDVSVKGLISLVGEQNNIADDLRTIQANSYLELQGIHEDTTAMSKAMKSMSGDVADIKKKIKDM
nr:MAG TPA: tail tape measure protein [Caudoviricetes sp.]